LEEIYYPDDPIPLYLDKKSETLKITQYLRNEAHRFGITFHRNKRSKTAIQSELEQIPTIGKQTITTLLRKFKSAKRVKEATFNALKDEIGNARALRVYEFFHPKKEP
jgi:excinuclease ABC subunit C